MKEEKKELNWVCLECAAKREVFIPENHLPTFNIGICDICGEEGARLRHVTRSYGQGETLLVIENVPVVSCPHCGESYLTAETLYEIERIKLHQRSLAQERPVLVAVFA